MHREVEEFIQYIENNSHLKHGIAQMSVDDFSNFIKTVGFSFTIDDFASTMKEIDNNTHQSKIKLNDNGLKQQSTCEDIDISLETLQLYRVFFD